MAKPQPRQVTASVSTNPPAITFAVALSRAIDRRRKFIDERRTEVFRALSGDGEGAPGVFVDVYGPGAVLVVHEGRAPLGFDAAAASRSALEVLRPLGVGAVYFKPFFKDRSKLGGELPECTTDPTPAAGEPLPEALIVREVDWRLEIRLYDGLSTGLFLDQRENRAALAQAINRRVAGAGAGPPPAVLNMFAYTCAFSIATAKAGAITTSVDVSGRYLDWGKRNFAHNGLDPAPHRFARMDAFEFLAYAKRKGLTYDLVILDPPSFASGSKKKGYKAFSSTSDYANLVRQAASILNRDGAIFASTNTLELCRPAHPGGLARFEREIAAGLGTSHGQTPRWLPLPPASPDLTMERERFAARLFTV